MLVSSVAFMWSSSKNELTAQFCNTPNPTESDYKAIPWYGDESNYTSLDRMYDSLISIYDSSTTLRSYEEGMLLRVPLKFWIYQSGPGIPGGNSGFDPPNEFQLQFAVDRLNSAFRDNGISIRFFIYGIQYISDNLAVVMDSYTERLVYASPGTGYYEPSALNVHVVDDGGDIKEVGYDAVFVERSRFRQTMNSTLTHEIGHYFGLLHTFVFNDVLCFREPVSRGLKWSACPPLILSKRCVFTGDLLCDTDADPNMTENGNYTSNCTWSWNGTDAYGDTYHPNLDNYMAYNNGQDACRSDFTSGQKKWMVVWAFTQKDAVQKGWLPSNNDQFDIYEPDNEAIAARTILPGETQEHTFHKKGRTDVDWLVFTAPTCGLTKPVSFILTNVTNNAIDEVAFFERNANGNEGAELTATENNGTYTLTSTSLIPGEEYLIRITKATDNSEYKVEFPFVNSCVNGPSIVCATNTSFSIAQRPSGSSISWAKSGNLVSVSGQGTNTYTVKATSSAAGAGWVKATINYSGQSYVLPVANIWSGKPAGLNPDDVSGPACVVVPSTVQYFVEPWPTYYSDVGASDMNISWAFGGTPSGVNFTKDPNRLRVDMTTTSSTALNQSYTFSIAATNQCGAGSASFVTFQTKSSSQGCGGGKGTFSFLVSPNPTSDQVNVIFEDTEDMVSYFEEVKQPLKVEIINPIAELKYRGVINKNGLTIDLSKMEPGLYLVRVTGKDYEQTARLIIE